MTELAVLILVTTLFLRNVRTAVGPIAILLFSVFFTALPFALFDQTINLFSLAGLCIAIGEIVLLFKEGGKSGTWERGLPWGD